MARQKQSWLVKIGTGILRIPFFLLLVPLVLVAVVCFWSYRFTLYLLIWLLWLPNGKDILFVYSDSSIWKNYMVTEVLPLVGSRAIVLNYSERKNWRKWSLSVRIFEMFRKRYDYNPMVMLFPSFRGVKTFRFFYAFQEFKQGRPEEVEQIRNALLQAL